MRGKRGRGADKKTSVFLLRYPSCNCVVKGLLKRNRTSLYAQTLALPKSYYLL
ncbi:hypothetical protein [Campylobacter troglodytis]|uniref:hypothetical protein n=1 Tax=Campylobacter troglodytis TaxID=654363 RepID=UPI001FE3C2D2|nr:hypothetical protein [Campylobacter troglodytis]